MATDEKSIKNIVLDAGPLILNEPPISSLLAKCEQLYSTASVLSEIRDATARQRVENTVIPFLIIRSPSPASIKTISDFARKTGDLSVLSRTDLEVIALAYELECEKNGGDWRLRKVPGQKELNGSPPGGRAQPPSTTEPDKLEQNTNGSQGTTETVVPEDGEHDQETVTRSIETFHISDKKPDLVESQDTSTNTTESQQDQDAVTAASDSDANISDADDSDGEWITPGNLASRIATDNGEIEGTTEVPSGGRGSGSGGGGKAGSAPVVLQVATITGDFALQNVLLQMNLNLLSSRLGRVRVARSHVQRCHACFAVWRNNGDNNNNSSSNNNSNNNNMERQFCARCGQPTLTRVACSTRDDGSFVLHLKRNYQHVARGNRYSIPKPAAGTASGKGVRGGGKGGWGNGLILAEDQKEYTRALRDAKREQRRAAGGLMDDDYLPSILTGKRGPESGGKPKIGAGRNVNSRKR